MGYSSGRPEACVTGSTRRINEKPAIRAMGIRSPMPMNTGS